MIKEITVKFLAYFNDKIELVEFDSENLEVNFSNGGETEEGWSWEYEFYSLDTDDDGIPVVMCKRVTEARDCDGRFDTSCTHMARLDRLAAQSMEDGLWFAPEWIEMKHGQRDYTAEAAGY
jgi:hypothetical protein